MVIYVLVVLMLFFNLNNRTRQSFYFQALWLFLIGFLRADTVGTDVLSYCDLVESISSEFGATEDLDYMYADIEPGFIFLIKCFKNISSDPMFFIRSIFLLYFLNICISIPRLSSIPNYTLFVYFTLSFYFFSFNGIRQAFALSLILVIISLLYRKTHDISISKLEPYLLAAIAIFITGMLFHRSLIICSIIPFIIVFRDRKCFDNRVLIITLIVSMFASVFFSSFLGKVFAIMDLSFLGSDKYVSYLDQLKVDKSFSFVSNILHGLFAVYLLYTTRQRNVWLLLYTIGTLILVLFSPLSWLFIRVADNFNIFIIFALPDIVKEWSNNRLRTLYRSAVILYCIVLFFNRLHDDNGDVIPYKCILFS